MFKSPVPMKPKWKDLGHDITLEITNAHIVELLNGMSVDEVCAIISELKEVQEIYEQIKSDMEK